MTKKEVSTNKQFLVLRDNFEKKIAKLKKQQDKILSELRRRIDEKKLAKAHKKIKTIKK